MPHSVRLLPAAFILTTFGLVACAGGGTSPVATRRDHPGRYPHPTGAGDVVVELRYEGGLTPTPVPALTPLPAVLITGDGRVIDGAPVDASYPGPLLPGVEPRPIAEADIQRLVARADRDGLLADAIYRNPTGIADARTVVVTVAAGGRTYVHRAYALGNVPAGDGRETDPARARLADFVGVLLDVQRSGPDARAESPYQTASYLIRAWPAAESAPGGSAGIEPTVVAWPPGAPVRLAAADRCVEVPAAPLRDLLSASDQLTRFSDRGVVYQLAVSPRLPGRGCG